MRNHPTNIRYFVVCCSPHLKNNFIPLIISDFIFNPTFYRTTYVIISYLRTQTIYTMKVRIEIHLDPKEVKLLDKLAASQDRSRKNLCEATIKALITQADKK